jgi:hypothetical protein
MAGLRLLGVLSAALAVALVLNVAVCLLPENGYQRWQLQDPDGRLRWIYERIHFDPTPMVTTTASHQIAISECA